MIRSFGRIKSRKLSQRKNKILEELCPKYKITQDKFLEYIKINKFNKINLEIGFGHGNFLFKQSKQNPSELFIGCEPYINGYINILGKLESNPLQNILLFNEDFRMLAPNLGEDLTNIFNKIFILFPDPWPKSKHFKRRLIDKKFLDNIIYPIIKNNGELIIATDHDNYKTWILSNILKSDKFEWNAHSKNDWKKFPNYWHKTKYQQKASEEGRDSIIFKLTPKK